MKGLCCFPFLRRKGRAASVRAAFSGLAVTVVTVGFLASCADADSSDFSAFHGESDDWVGNCFADFVVGTPTAGMIDARLTVLCDHRPTVEETMSGPFVPRTGRYHAIVTGIKTAPNFTYDEDKNFDLTLAGDGCSMFGTVTDTDGTSKISFDSTDQACQ
jgi:hypothetical protein